MPIEERRERKKAYMVKWRAEHPEHVQKYAAWAKTHYASGAPRYDCYARRGNLKAKYGLTLEAYEAMLTAQGGVCALCGNPPKQYRLAVDHQHETGKVRKLLCAGCNHKLAVVEDQAFCAKAQAYLEDFNG